MSICIYALVPNNRDTYHEISRKLLLLSTIWWHSQSGIYTSFMIDGFYGIHARFLEMLSHFIQNKVIMVGSIISILITV